MVWEYVWQLSVQRAAVRTSLIQVVSDNLSKEPSSLKGVVKDLGQAELKLPTREAMVVASPLVFFGERIGQAGAPFVEECLDRSHG